MRDPIWANLIGFQPAQDVNTSLYSYMKYTGMTVTTWQYDWRLEILLDYLQPSSMYIVFSKMLIDLISLTSQM